VLLRDSERIDRSFVQRLYSGTEMRDLLARTGFRNIQILGSLEGSPYDQGAKSLIALDERPE